MHWASATLPATVVTASTLVSGDPQARSSASASSTPGSVSMTRSVKESLPAVEASQEAMIESTRDTSRGTKEEPDGPSDLVLRRVKLPPPGLQFAGRHQGQVQIGRAHV